MITVNTVCLLWICMPMVFFWKLLGEHTYFCFDLIWYAPRNFLSKPMLMTLTSNLHWACVYIKKHVTLWTNFCEFFFMTVNFFHFLLYPVLFDAWWIFSVCFQYVCFSLFSICCNNACSLFYMYNCLYTVNSLIVMKRILIVISNTKC